ncbi:hypothetical protein J3454_00020 [Erythrobacter sp. NFXS35]|uniref:hypothetical protein n=1 Tax=Erythrobacter sp. NFXS35 TaxID=2818436 RepID=UPI0032DFE3C2
MTALATLIMTGAPRELANPREAALIAVPAGKELGLHEQGFTRDRDVVAVAFQPGQEHEGPTNIAVYERLNNKIRINPRCSPWYSPNPELFMIAAHDDETGYGYSNARLVRFGPVPRADFAIRLMQGTAALQRAATAAPGLAPFPFRPK